MPCSDSPDFVPTSSIPFIIIAILSTSISSSSSITDALPIIESSTQPASPMEPESLFSKQKTLPPVSLTTTQLDDLPHSPTGIHSINVPIHAHHLINDFLDEQTNVYLSNQLLDSCFATTLDGHMDMGSPLYALYNAFLQYHHLSTPISTNTTNVHHALCK